MEALEDVAPIGADDRANAMRTDLGLITPDDLATIIGVGVRQLQVWRSSDMGPDYVKLGKQVFYRRTDVLSWVEANVNITKHRGV